ncbi:MAG: hypothetical protein KatS3mg010_0539 [Acidimicrobiia bacterium]|nr:MAG: hypothetical protein KatS3mg010_0539 [Acidimicrobiia bacterium]
MVALPAAYQLFRTAYYGSVVANTAIAKEGARINWDRGWRYFTDFSTPYWLWFVGLVVLVGGYLPLLATTIGGRSRRPLAVAVVFPVAGILDAMYVVAVGGDYLHARLFLPALFAISAPVAAVPAVRRNAATIALVPWVFARAAAARVRRAVAVELPGRAQRYRRSDPAHVRGRAHDAATGRPAHPRPDLSGRCGRRGGSTSSGTTANPTSNELYDLQSDPHQLDNLLATAAGQQTYANVKRILQTRLDALKTCAGTSCR